MVIAVRVGLYLAACWLTVGMLANGLFPHAVLVVVALAAYTTLPLLVSSISNHSQSTAPPRL